MKRVLFLCTGNSARSILAEALLNASADTGWRAWSAGVEPKGIHLLTRAVLEESGISTCGLRSKGIDEFIGQPFDWVITLCNSARQNCPLFPGQANRLHWDLPDPAEATGSEAERLAAFRLVRDDLRCRIEALMQGEVR